ncbi:MAG: hypothetical protein JWQ70_1205 [Aeromicrobium sp.]|nr:hypothetical protein [Aeromicrobium sp.]
MVQLSHKLYRPGTRLRDSSARLGGRAWGRLWRLPTGLAVRRTVGDLAGAEALTTLLAAAEVAAIALAGSAESVLSRPEVAAAGEPRPVVSTGGTSDAEAGKSADDE